MNRLVFIFAIFAASSAQSSDKSFLVIIIHHFGELSGMFRCLGTMISDQHVLTAASCVNKTGVDHIYLHLNPLDSALSDTSPFYYFDEVFTYPETESDDQLAILKVKKHYNMTS